MSEHRRITIGDIAAEAGVSVASVSYALNGKPGVSSETRERILGIARLHNWEPHHLARALQGASTDVIGLIVPMAVANLHDEGFWMLFISGIESELRQHGKSLMLHIEPDAGIAAEIYHSWQRRGVVDCVILTDLQPEDHRVPLLAEIGLPAVLAGRPDPDPGWPYCFASDADDMQDLLLWLRERGNTRYARLAGDPSYVFVRERAEVWHRDLADLADCGTVHVGFYPDEDDVAQAVAELMQGAPEVIVTDSDLLAVRALRALFDAGHRVPTDVQLVSFDESIFCQIVTPRLTAVDRDPRELGRAAARLALGTETARIYRTTPGVIHERESTRGRDPGRPAGTHQPGGQRTT